MNRRFFLTAVSAMVASPALPAMPLPVAPQHMKVARILARAHNRCTPEMLVRHLKVTPDLAAQIQMRLLRQGVITAPVSGVSLATNPTNTGCIPNEAMKPNNLIQKAAQLREKLDQFQSQPSQEDETMATSNDPNHLADMRIESCLNNPSTSNGSA